jgi:hypothetical protein
VTWWQWSLVLGAAWLVVAFGAGVAFGRMARFGRDGKP